MDSKGTDQPVHLHSLIRDLAVLLQKNSILWNTILILNFGTSCLIKTITCLNPCPAEPGYTLPFLKKPTDLDLHCLALSM